MTQVIKLGLGTVQFGTAYGVSGHPQPTIDQVHDLLVRARSAGIDLLDTAPGYGNSETLLNGYSDFQIVTKLPPGTFPYQAEVALQASLKKLGRSQVYCLLVHQASDLLGEEAASLFEVMTQLKAKGLAQKIGVSVYHPDEAQQLLNRYHLDVIQFPMNVLDQRFVPLIPYMQAKQVELHVRSLFLQGLLLMPMDTVPPFFDPIRGHLNRYHDTMNQVGYTPLQAAFGFAAQFPTLRWIVGVHSVGQLEDMIGAATTAKATESYAQWAIQDESFLLPYRWRLS